MKTFHVQNYKGLKDLELAGLARVNLIIGRNNVGKSSLLEALSIRCSGGSVAEMLDILKYGGEKVISRLYLNDEHSPNNESQFLSLFHRGSFAGQVAPEIELADDQFSVKIEVGYRREKKIQNGSTVSRVAEYLGEKEYLALNDSNGIQAEKGIIILVKNSFHDFIPFHDEFNVHTDSSTGILVRPADYMYSNAMLYDKIAMSEKENQLISALRIIEPQIQRINYLESDPGSRKRVPFVIVGPDAVRVRLSTMGDGINRILTIILSLLNCPSGGALFLDEIDNGLHYSVQAQLWEMIFDLASKMDVQVFATTHSMDCLRSFGRVNTSADGLLIRLDARRNGDIVPQYYSDSEDIRLAVEKQIELR